MFVVTHFPCDDGKLAGLVWLSRFPNSTINNWIHGDSQMIKMLQFDSSEKIVFLDVCPNILYLNPNNNYLIIDHHENAINSIKAHQSSNIELFVDTKYSGCMLTWMYCYGNKPFPKIINHIGKKDIWDFSDHDTEPYCIGFNEVIINEVIINEVITKLLFDDTNDLHNIFIENGKKLINKYIQEAAQIFKNYKVEDNIIEIILHSNNNVLYKSQVNVVAPYAPVGPVQPQLL